MQVAAKQDVKAAEWKFTVYKNNHYGILVLCPKCGEWGRLTKRHNRSVPKYYIIHGEKYSNQGHWISYFSNEFESVDKAYNEAQDIKDRIIRNYTVPDVVLSTVFNVPVEVVRRIKTQHVRYTDHTEGIWSKKEIEKLIELYENGEPLRKIAKELGRTYAAVKTRLNMLRKQGKLDVRRINKDGRTRWTEDEEEFLIEMFTQGYTMPDIARELGRTYNAVKAKVRALRRQGRLGYFKASTKR